MARPVEVNTARAPQATNTARCKIIANSLALYRELLVLALSLCQTETALKVYI